MKLRSLTSTPESMVENCPHDSFGGFSGRLFSRRVGEAKNVCSCYMYTLILGADDMISRIWYCNTYSWFNFRICLASSWMLTRNSMMASGGDVWDMYTLPLGANSGGLEPLQINRKEKENLTERPKCKSESRGEIKRYHVVDVCNIPLHISRGVTAAKAVHCYPFIFANIWDHKTQLSTEYGMDGYCLQTLVLTSHAWKAWRPLLTLMLGLTWWSASSYRPDYPAVSNLSTMMNKHFACWRILPDSRSTTSTAAVTLGSRSWMASCPGGLCRPGCHRGMSWSGPPGWR